MSDGVTTRRGRKIVTIEPGTPGKLVIRCPGLNCDYPAILLPSREGVRYALTAECRLYSFDWAWAGFFDSRSSKPHSGDSRELVNVTLGELDQRLPEWRTNLDLLFGPGASAAAQLLGKDGRAGLRELRATLEGGDTSAKRNRAQALVTFPLLSTEIVLKGSERRRAVTITRLIDQGAPLMRELPAIFKTRPWMIRHLRGLNEEDIQPFRSAAELLGSMDWLTPERAPTGRGQYTLLSFFSNRLCQSDQPYGWIAHSIRRSVLKIGWPAFGTYVHLIDDILDYGRFVTRLADGLTRHSDDAAEAIDAALGHPQFRQIVRLSERWHDIERQIRLDPTISPDTSASGAWRPLFGSPLVFDGYRLQCLSTRQELLTEGDALNHCVASYADRCEAGETHIVRVTRDDEAVATAELQLTGRRGASRSVTVRQVRGPRNTLPEPGVVKALQQLVEALAGKDLSDFPEPFDAARQRPDNAVTCLFERALRMHGTGAIRRYRDCLISTSGHTSLWDHVVARCRGGRLARVSPLQGNAPRAEKCR